MNPVVWAKVAISDNVVVNTELATAEWVDEWTLANPDSEYRYILTEQGTIRQASVGWTYDPDNGYFYPSKPEGDGWVWSDEMWNWYIPEPSIPD